MASSHPPMTWAQDRNHVFITVKIQDFANELIEFHENDFIFKGKTKNPQMDYDMVFNFFNEIVPDHEETKYSIFGRNVLIELRKKNPKIWWPRLAQTSQKLHNVKIDWERWIDDDEEDFEDIKAKHVSTDSDADSDSDSENLDKVEPDNKAEEEKAENAAEENQTENVE